MEVPGCSKRSTRLTMIITEFRIPLPFTLAQYRIGQLYLVAEMSLNESGGGEGVEIITNEAFSGKPRRKKEFDSGIYTYKIYHMKSRIPSFVRLLLDSGQLDVHEESYNCYPYFETIVTNPGFMKEKFKIVIESFHMFNDVGNTENVLGLSDDDLKNRTIVHIDIGNDPFSGTGDADFDPSVFQSRKGKFGPLRGNWIKNANPVMTCYKLVRAEFKWLGFQKKVEQWIQVNEHKLFTRFHRQLYCTVDKWCDLTLADVRKREDKVQQLLKRAIDENPPKEKSMYTPSELYEMRSRYLSK